MLVAAAVTPTAAMLLVTAGTAGSIASVEAEVAGRSAHKDYASGGMAAGWRVGPRRASSVASGTEGGDILGRGDTLEAGHEHDLALSHGFLDARRNIERLEHAIADFSTVPFMCLVASFQVELDPLNFEMTSPWQFSQVVDVVWVPPGGVAWQDLPQASWVPSTLFHTGA